MEITLRFKRCFDLDAIKRIHFGRCLVRAMVLVGQKVVWYFKIIILLIMYVWNIFVGLLWVETNFRTTLRSQISSLEK